MEKLTPYKFAREHPENLTQYSYEELYEAAVKAKKLSKGFLRVVRND